jgi:cytochrome c oxidase accessory protein FixG
VGSFWIGTASTAVYGFTALFTASTYLLAGWAREQVCTFMCPWPRFQAAMFDEQSFIVTYQAWRGEPRGHVKAAAKGDCIDCGACVTACPTGIDIRDGVQLECIGCGLCIDACNDIMTKTAREPWLITWDSLARQNAKANARTASGPAAKLPPIRLLRPRTIIYATAMVLALTVMSVALATRSTISLSLQQDRAPLFVRLPDGSVRNGFTVKIVNKTQMDAVFDLDMHGLGEDTMALAETHTERGTALVLPVAADQVGSFRVLVTAFTHGEEHPVDFTLHDRGTGQTVTAHALFHGPGRIERHDEHDD